MKYTVKFPFLQFRSLFGTENFDLKIRIELWGLKLIFNLQNQQKIESAQLFTRKIATELTWKKN